MSWIQPSHIVDDIKQMQSVTANGKAGFHSTVSMREQPFKVGYNHLKPGIHIKNPGNFDFSDMFSDAPDISDISDTSDDNDISDDCNNSIFMRESQGGNPIGKALVVINT